MDNPGPDELEVVLIGPGYGESIVVHLGHGEWAVVDSCVRSRGGRSAPLEYLDKLGVDISRDVRLVVATHWHDDHVRGLAQVVRESERAIFCCSSALRGQEFTGLLKARNSVPGSRFSSGVREFAEIAAVSKQRSSDITWAVSGRRLAHYSHSIVSSIWTLSPADADVQYALDELASLNTTKPEAVVISSNWNANKASVVLFLETRIGGGILLGGDLEHLKGLPPRGWHGIIDDDGRPEFRASLFKVPHHGSLTAHCPSVWGAECIREPASIDRVMLSPGETVSILAPWANADKKLPLASDMDRLRSLSSGVHLTTTAQSAFAPSAGIGDSIAARMAYHSHIVSADPRPGSLRCRFVDGAWSVQAIDW